MISPSEEGFGRDTEEKAFTVAKSLMAQFETLALELQPAFLTKCTVSYAKLLLIPSCKYMVRMSNQCIYMRALSDVPCLRDICVVS